MKLKKLYDDLDSIEIVGGLLLFLLFTYGVLYVLLELVKRFYCAC